MFNTDFFSSIQETVYMMILDSDISKFNKTDYTWIQDNRILCSRYLILETSTLFHDNMLNL